MCAERHGHQLSHCGVFLIDEKSYAAGRSCSTHSVSASYVYIYAHNLGASNNQVFLLDIDWMCIIRSSKLSLRVSRGANLGALKQDPQDFHR
jgi:hypothetical protein